MSNDVSKLSRMLQAIFRRRRHQPRRPPLADHVGKVVRPPRLYKVASFHCGLMMPKGNSRANGISDRKSDSQPNCEHHRDFSHNLSSPNRRSFCSSSLLTTAAPPAENEKTAARQDQTRKSCTDDGGGDTDRARERGKNAAGHRRLCVGEIPEKPRRIALEVEYVYEKAVGAGGYCAFTIRRGGADCKIPSQCCTIIKKRRIGRRRDVYVIERNRGPS